MAEQPLQYSHNQAFHKWSCKLKQCFDSMWLQETINDLWEAGIDDNNLALLYKMNEEVQVAIKTPFG